ncbi:hypothetical protein [Bernardetia sp.]|uniref:hypothetical protein n=1 Tax=Bernardetia sp. TaxID=1937974 RepID=UPI0025C3982E|nr:hypothetical protein [Bernardetia sp.]
MCQSKEGIIFCTCKNEEIASSLYPNITWKLYRSTERILNLEKKVILGLALMSEDMLEEDLKADTVLEYLNNEEAQVFDFNYQPNKGDIFCLDKKEEKHTKSMRFLYEGSLWKVYEGILHDYVSIADGYIRPKKSDEKLITKDSLWTDEELVEKAKKHIDETEQFWKRIEESANKKSKFRRFLEFLGIK